jgi:hypothetical protein
MRIIINTADERLANWLTSNQMLAPASTWMLVTFDDGKRWSVTRWALDPKEAA